MFNLMNKLNFGTKDVNAAIYCLYDEVNDSEAKNITEWILAANFMPNDERPDVLNLIINSPGGSLTAAWAIVDMMRGSAIPIRTIGLGQIASAGLLIFISGDKGFRSLTDNTSILSHAFSAGAGGTYHDLLATTTEWGHTQQRLIKHLAKCSGLSNDDVVKKLMPTNDVWLTAQEAVKLGLADKVTSLK